MYFDYNFPIRTNEAQTTVACPVLPKILPQKLTFILNPVSDILYLDTNENWTKAEIYDISGRIMRSVSLDGLTIDVSGLESGTYFIRLKHGEKVGVVKFVKI
ncbi:MAG: T9SS type A sorting domain-containing protein [Saprospiraceae bacterium]|nr:T9SS type A sorting domain-containing protein [Saprospiraceae bacterium]